MKEPLAPALDVFAGPGQVRALAREIDWAATSLGPVAEWPYALTTIVRTILATPFPMSLWCGPDLLLVYNDAYVALLGDKHPRALGLPGRDVWRETWPKVEPIFRDIAEGGDAVFLEDEPFYVHRSGLVQDHPTPDEPNAWYTFSMSPVRDDEGSIVAYLNVATETTARVLAELAQDAARARAEGAERRLLDVFEKAPTFMAVLRGQDLVFEFVNNAYYQLVGDRELIGKPVFEALPEVRGQGFETLLEGVMETGEAYVGLETPIMVSRSPDSPPEEVFLDFVYYPITEPDGTRSGVVAHGSDVTGHVRARMDAQHARAEAERANSAKSQFLAMMSHEIRTPINAVIGYSDLLDGGVGGPLTERQHDFIERVRESSRHLLSLVDDILDLSRIEAGEEVITESVRLDAHTVIAAAVQMVAPSARRKEVELRDEAEGESVEFIGDRDRTRQIVLNLLTNAIKFTGSGGAISIRRRIVQEPAPHAALPEVGPWAVIEVEDNGIGISEDQLTRIFDPFVQVDSSHTRTASGTGLGLTISRRFARLMGGDLTVESTVGAGSCFSVWLPAPEQVVGA